MENHRILYSSINAVRQLKRNGEYGMFAAQFRAAITKMGEAAGSRKCRMRRTSRLVLYAESVGVNADRVRGSVT